MSKKLNDKIREILAEAAYEDLGPAVVTPWAMAGPNAASMVKPGQAKAPTCTNPVTGQRSADSDNPGAVAPVASAAPVEGDEEEDEDEDEKPVAKPEDDEEDEDEEGDEEEVKEAAEEEDDLDKTFTEMLNRLREEEGDEEEKPADAPAAGALGGAAPAGPAGAAVPSAPAAPISPAGTAGAAPVADDEDEDGKMEKIAEEEEEEEGEEDEKDGKKKKEEPVDTKDDEAAMFAGQQLPESFKQKASAIFRGTIARVVKEERKRTTAKLVKQLTEAVDILKAKAAKKQKSFEGKLTEQVDMYLNYVVENWMQENQLAVERGIRNELSEDFIRGLKKLFVEHYIEIPEEKVDVLKSMERQVTKLETKLNEQVQINAKQRQLNQNLKKDGILRSVCEGLEATRVEKLRTLAEGIEYTNRKEFTKRLTDLRDSYFPKEAKRTVETKQSITESVVEPVETEATSTNIDLYARTIARSKNR